MTFIYKAARMLSFVHYVPLYCVLSFMK